MLMSVDQLKQQWQHKAVPSGEGSYADDGRGAAKKAVEMAQAQYNCDGDVDTDAGDEKNRHTVLAWDDSCTAGAVQCLDRWEGGLGDD